MFDQIPVSNAELNILLSKNESHYLDFKDHRIDGKSLQRHLVGMANADGGELYIGISQSGTKFITDGFSSVEAGNQLIQAAILNTNPSIDGLGVEFLDTPTNGLIIKFIVPKSPVVHYTSSGDCYIRLSAQTQKLSGSDVTKLAYAKGYYRFEEKSVDASSIDDILNFGALDDYMARIGSNQDRVRFLRRNRLVDLDNGRDHPNVGCVILFDEEPDAVLPTKASVKVLRMKTDSEEYNRNQLASSKKLSGPLEQLSVQTEKEIFNVMKDASFSVGDIKFDVSYPVEAVHEVLVNAFLHRDYSISDEIQVIIYDNRITISSPGKLPGGVTVDNILSSHFARNPNLVRLINKLPDPLNHDLGEGLDTAFRAMNKAGLVPPRIEERDNAVVVTLRHKRIASYEEIIIDYLESHEWITNKIVRGLTGEDSENKVKKALQSLRSDGLIEPEDPNVSPFKFRYRKVVKE